MGRGKMEKWGSAGCSDTENNQVSRRVRSEGIGPSKALNHCSVLFLSSVDEQLEVNVRARWEGKRHTGGGAYLRRGRARSSFPSTSTDCTRPKKKKRPTTHHSFTHSLTLTPGLQRANRAGT